jgi:hypothetical protein
MSRLKVGVVGPCAAGKSTLVAGLERRGYWGKHIAQEHSYVQDMWQRISNPDVLIYLDVSYSLTIQRRKLNWTEDEYKEEIRRLCHARQHADLYLNTDAFTAQEVLSEVISFLEITRNQ